MNISDLPKVGTITDSGIFAGYNLFEDCMKYTKEQLTDIRDALLELGHQAETIPECFDKYHGLCVHLDEVIDVCGDSFVKNNTIGFNGLKRKTAFPIPGYIGDFACWTGEHAPTRRKLIDHLIGRCEDMLNEL